MKRPPKDEKDVKPKSSIEISDIDHDWFFSEINLLRIEGRYFCFDPKEAARRKNPKYEFIDLLKTPDRTIDRPLVIEPHPHYGYPSTFTYKVLQGIIKKLSVYGYPVPETVSLSQRELARIIGRLSFGGKDSKDLLKALMQLAATRVWCSFYNKETQEWGSVTFTVLNKMYFSGRENQINSCLLYIEPLVVNSFNSRHVFYLNYHRLESLEPIGLALFKRLFFHFSNIYHRQKSSDFNFKKDYGDICSEWLGDLKQERYKARILQQLGRHLQALRKEKLISQFEIEKNKKGDGFNIVFYPGKGFFEDYKRFYGKDFQLSMNFEKASDERRIQKPMELVAYFYKRRYQTADMKSLLPFSEKELEYASSLLEKHSFDDVKDLIDFTLQEAPRTDFDIKNFSAIRVYLPSWVSVREARLERAEEKRQEKEEILEKHLKHQYAEYKQAEVEKVKKDMPEQAIREIQDSVRSEILAKEKKPLALDKRTQIKADQIIAEQSKILGFDEWKLYRE